MDISNNLFDYYFSHGISEHDVEWIPLKDKTNVKLGDPIISAIGTHGVIVQIVDDMKDMDNSLSEGYWVFLYNEHFMYEKKVFMLAKTDAGSVLTIK